MTQDSLGDRQKSYEMAEAGRKLLPLLPIMVRLDGRSFHSYTKGMARPYDAHMMEVMRATTKYLVEETNARLGYTQSDEITLVLYSETLDSQVFFDRRIQKLCSITAAMASSYFNLYASKYWPSKPLAHFDSRVWSVPTLDEAANAVLWRERDATKNSITMAARCHYSDKTLMHKNSSEKQEMLFAVDINWNEYPAAFKRGSYVLRRDVTRAFTAEDLSALPPKHKAHTDPSLVVTRSVIDFVELPPLGSIRNKAGVLFQGEEPVLWT